MAARYDPGAWRVHLSGELGRGSVVFLLMARPLFMVWLLMGNLALPAWPVVAAAQTVDYARTLEQARQLAREDLPPVQPDAVPAPRASVLDHARPQSLGVKPVLPNPGDRLGVRVDTEAAPGLRPYVGADIEAGRVVDGLPAPTLELGASVSTGRDTNVSAGVRQPPPAAGAPAAPPPGFQLGIERRF